MVSKSDCPDACVYEQLAEDVQGTKQTASPYLSTAYLVQTTSLSSAEEIQVIHKNNCTVQSRMI